MWSDIPCRVVNLAVLHGHTIDRSSKADAPGFVSADLIIEVDIYR